MLDVEALDQIRSETGVPFLDLRRIHDDLTESILANFAALIGTSAFVNGPEIAEFERAFADYCGVAECVGVSSGLDALRLALMAAGIESGDEVIVPAMTFAATFEAVTQAGARPVVVDIAESDYGIDVAAMEAVLTPRTRFVVPVHLYGQLANLRGLVALAEEHGLAVIEDACQAHGASREGLRAGEGGLAAAFSFYPSKNLGAMGDAGALVTNDAALSRRARALREHGQVRKYEHYLEGYTARLDTLQAIVLKHKLPSLDAWNGERRETARFYSTHLVNVGDLRLPVIAPESDPVWYLYVVRTKERHALAAFLAERGIGTGRHYPQLPPLSRAYAFLGHGRGDFPVAEALADEGLSLPIYPGITEPELAAVAASIREFFRHG